MSTDIPCSSCEKPAAWAVTVPEAAEGAAGELKAYCDACRQEHSEVAASIPLALVDDDVFIGLYRGGFTRTDPGIAVSMLFGREMPDLAERARHALPQL